MATTLREFVRTHELNPEDGGRGLDWFCPDTMIFKACRREGPNTELHIFSDGATQCGILDTAETSVLLSEDELGEYESGVD